MSQQFAARSASPIQRLVIIHLNLAELCLNGHSLGEGASLEELGEQILYYHRERALDDNTVGSSRLIPDSEHTSTEAIQFVGLCIALYTLPVSLGETACESDFAKEVYFGESKLIFAPLESSRNILAVAQVPRLYLRGSASDVVGGNPMAIRASLQKFHRLFCLLRGGGICRRLAGPTRPNLEATTPEDGIPYPGMDKLYALRKELRNLQYESSRQLDWQSDEDLPKTEEEKVLRCRISELLQTLPIQPLRRDLREHYNEFLTELSISASRVGSASRCLVEMVPAPISLPSDEHVSHSVASIPSAYCSVSLGLAMRQLLDEFSHHTNDSYQLLGISTFFDGQILYTHTSEGPVPADRLPNRPTGGYILSISNETACLIMSYMASYRSKNHHEPFPSRSESPARMPTQPRLGLKRLGLSFGTAAEEETLKDYERNEASAGGCISEQGHYLEPPLISMLSTSDRSHIFEGNNNCRVWVPLLHIPICFALESEPTTMSIDAHVILYDIRGFSFLIYIYPLKDVSSHRIQSVESNDTVFTSTNLFHGVFLDDLSRFLTEAVGLSMDSDFAASQPSLGDVSGLSKAEIRLGICESGQDVIFVDRRENKLILFSARAEMASNYGRERTKAGGGISRRGLLGLTSNRRLRLSGRSSSSQDARSSNSDWSALGLDCRHRLASYFTLDTLLAFDDVMNEVNGIRKNKSVSNDDLFMSTSSEGLVELCTCMPNGWIYAYADENRELYSFFDSQIYVTVADVQNAARRTREHLFGELAT